MIKLYGGKRNTITLFRRGSQCFIAGLSLDHLPIDVGYCGRSQHVRLHV